MSRKQLLDFAFAAGCAGKACQTDLFAILKGLPKFRDEELLIGAETMDDAGVYRLNNRSALVLTVDVLGPIANDPFIFGQIAAANSLSDVYAMGGKPVACLSVLGFPVAEIEHKQIRALLAGAIAKVREAGAVLAGGHTFKDMEVKFGLAVVGLLHPERVVTNANACPGDVLILTKPIGTGIITTALKEQRVARVQVRMANRQMLTLNRAAAEIMVDVGVNAATDVTGFGLLGHAWEMAQASRVNLIIDADRVPVMDGVQQLAANKVYPAGTIHNYQFIKRYTSFARHLSAETRLILCDAQTSGGLLISVPERRSSRLLARLLSAGVEKASVIGYVEKGKGRFSVL
ncbi:MAG: selenide, water dikinase SelD [bacterium]